MLGRSGWRRKKGPEERGVAGGVPASSRLAGQVPRGPGWRPVLPWLCSSARPVCGHGGRGGSARRGLCAPEAAATSRDGKGARGKVRPKAMGV